MLGQAGGCLKQCRKGRSMKSKDMNFKIIPFVYNFFVTLPETNSPLEKEIPIGNHYFFLGYVSFGECSVFLTFIKLVLLLVVDFI